jgi:hypothetical protein
MHVETLFSAEWTAPFLLLIHKDSTTMAISLDVMVYSKRFVMNGKHIELIL